VDAVTAQARPSRHVECKGAFNVRDLGGYRTVDDRTIRWRTIFRADGLHCVPGTSETALAELGWRTVIDLRSAAETEVGTYRCDGVEVVHLPVLRETWDPAMFVDDGDHVGFLVERYLEMLDEGAPAFAASVEILAASDRLPAVFHCSAGKDRTGVLASLVLAVLGVADHQIAADYHLSALAMDQLVAWLVENRPDLVDVPGPSGRGLALRTLTREERRQELSDSR
jgi:protein-tyrosine phosphatase